jgi:hypothetical protein
MNNSTNNRFLWLTILGLLLLNIGLLGWIWFGTNSSLGKEPPSFLPNELGFDQAQAHQYDILRKAHFKEVKPIRDSTKILKDDLFSHLANPTLSDADLKALTNAIAQNIERSDWLTFKHLQEVRKLCTPAQKEVFDATIQDIMRKQAHGGMPPPPMREGPPPPR